MACLYKRKGKYWVSYYYGNRQMQKSLKTSDLKVANAKKKRIEYEVSLGDLHIASKLPLPVILEAFCRHLQATRTFKSFKNDFSRLRTFFGPVCESLQLGSPGQKGNPGQKLKDKYAGLHVKAGFLEDICPEAINHFISERIELNSWSPKSANLLRQILHKLFSYAIKHHGFRSRDRRYPNPVAYVERYREPATEISFLSIRQIDEQLKILKPYPVIHTLCATYIYAGLRREEALWLTKDDVLLDKRLIKIQAKTIDNQFWQPKTKSNRVVPISNALYDILSSYELLPGCIWFFPSPSGKQWNTDNFSNDLREINKKNNLEWSCLDFRHTFGTHLAQKGESLYKISKLMGNSPEICRKHYAALIPEEMADVVEFTEKTTARQNDGDTQELLREILSEIKGKPMPKIRIVK